MKISISDTLCCLNTLHSVTDIESTCTKDIACMDHINVLIPNICYINTKKGFIAHPMMRYCINLIANRFIAVLYVTTNKIRDICQKLVYYNYFHTEIHDEDNYHKKLDTKANYKPVYLSRSDVLLSS